MKALHDTCPEHAIAPKNVVPLPVNAAKCCEPLIANHTTSAPLKGWLVVDTFVAGELKA